MYDLADPFLTVLETNPDFSPSEDAAACQRLIDRQDAIDRWLRGETPPEEVLDVLSSQGINPDTYVDSVCSQVDHVIENGLVYDSDEAGLLLPRYLDPI